jgi:hypothetical protein
MMLHKKELLVDTITEVIQGLSTKFRDDSLLTPVDTKFTKITYKYII